MQSVRSNGFIFGCTEATEVECRQRRLFGLPGKHSHIVHCIRPNTPIFLFNYDRRVLYGVFWSTCRGSWNLDPRAWGGRFPAQIRVRGISTTVKNGEVLTESQFRPVLSKNYFDRGRFTYTLTSSQVSTLMQLLHAQGWNSNSGVAKTLRNEMKGNITNKTPNWKRGHRPYTIHKQSRRPPRRNSHRFAVPHTFQDQERCFAPFPEYCMMLDRGFHEVHPKHYYTGARRHPEFPYRVPGHPPQGQGVYYGAAFAASQSLQGMRTGLCFPREMYPVLPGTYLLPQAPVTPEALRPVRPPLTKDEKLSYDSNQSWKLGERKSKDSQSFKKFLTGQEDSVPPEVPSARLGSPMESIEGSAGGLEEGEITEEVVDLASMSEDEVMCLGPIEGIQEEPLERKVCLVKYKLTKNFGVSLK
eukprot:g197.t1